ncbi:M1 family peptidase [Flavobacteriaceae bacterium Ap0902]|nr:M1 family peptidase [Flavobacteriaceae bacterium Ap0902]
MSKIFLQKNKYFLVLLIFFISCNQKFLDNKNNYTQDLLTKTQHYDSDILRGSNTEFRNWWNVLHYDITFKPNYKNKSISGSVTMHLQVTNEDNNGIIQIDLQEPMQITEIIQLKADNIDSNQIVIENVISGDKWIRDRNAYFIDISHLPKERDSQFTLQMYFEGKPKIAKQAPWDGGWIFKEDELGRPWMSAAVQGLGSSAWFPSKDYWGDEPDQGVKISILVPEDLVAIANGKLWESSFVKDEVGNNIYTWEVQNPINTYNIIPYIGYYKNFKDEYVNSAGESLQLDYWVLDYNINWAKKQFSQVKPMLEIFEDWMGSYPFYEDSYKLVEAPYLGMEHQSNVAYGNGFENGYLGEDRSGSGWGNQFDFIIIHESGHEWFGNSITAQDPADMWIHEAFTTYTEVMYVEGRFGVKAANEYVQGLKPAILNDRPMIGILGKHKAGSIDMYNKGANMIHTLRQWMDDDVKFKQLIRDINKTFYHQTITSVQLEGFILQETGLPLEPFFNQYLRQKDIPILETKEENGELYYRWRNTIPEFNMPVKLEKSVEWIKPTTTWQVYAEKSQLKPDSNFLIEFEKSIK